MDNKMYKSLYLADIIERHKCTKEEYDSSSEELKAYEDPNFDAHWIYDEVNDIEELKLKLMINQSRNIKTIKNIVVCFTILWVIGTALTVLAII